MWACAQGHTEAALALFSWSKGTLLLHNREGNLPLMVARQHGHHNLADQLEQLHMSCDQSHGMTSSPSSSKSHDQCPGSVPTNLYTIPSQAIDSVPFAVDMCSDGLSVSIEGSAHIKDYPSEMIPGTCSNTFSRDVESAVPPGKVSMPQSPENSSLMSELHINIPTIPLESSDLMNKTMHLKQKRENPCDQRSDQTTQDMTAHGSTCKCSIHATNQSLQRLDRQERKSAAEKRQKLQKRFSVDIISNQTLEPVHFSPTSAFTRPVREANSEPHLSGNMEHLVCQGNPMLSAGREMGKWLG